MNVLPITNLIMDDVCKNIRDVYQVAFYNIGNFEIEKKISLNIEQNNCNKYRIFDLNWLKTQEKLMLPDVLIMKPTEKLTMQQKELLINLNIKIRYVDENILENNKLFEDKIDEIERTIYKSRILKYFEIQKSVINDIESKYSNNSASNEKLTQRLIDELLELIKDKDDVTYEHIKNVSEYVDIFISGMPENKKLNKEEINFLKKAALIHDIGKLTVPNQILRKKEKLNDNEYNGIKKHVAENAYLFNNKLMQDYKEVVLAHHERYDGKGYPRGLKGDEIPYYARVISVIDAFEAMTGNREYIKNQPQKSLFQVLKILQDNAGTQFDPEIVNYFVQGVINCPEFQIKISQGGRSK